MCKVLMSIKLKYATQILNGAKTVEYRKNRFRRQNGEAIVIYTTSPIMKVIGEVKLVGMLEDRPEIIWKKICHSGGINKMAYDDYFKGKDKAIAYMLGKVEKYENELKISDFHIHVPPQSYVYRLRRVRR